MRVLNGFVDREYYSMAQSQNHNKDIDHIFLRGLLLFLVWLYFRVIQLDKLFLSVCFEHLQK